MNVHRMILIPAVMVGVLFTVAAATQDSADPGVQLRAAIEAEEVDGDLQAAIAQYRQIVASAGTDRAVVAKALARIRRTGKPVFIQPNVKAWPGSHKAVPEYTTGVTDLALAWDAKRSKGPNAAWNRTDPILRMARVLLRAKQASRTDIEAIDAKIARRLKSALAYAEASPFPKPLSALTGVYA